MDYLIFRRSEKNVCESDWCMRMCKLCEQELTFYVNKVVKLQLLLYILVLFFFITNLREFGLYPCILLNLFRSIHFKNYHILYTRVPRQEKDGNEIGCQDNIKIQTVYRYVWHSKCFLGYIYSTWSAHWQKNYPNHSYPFIHWYI